MDEIALRGVTTRLDAERQGEVKRLTYNIFIAFPGPLDGAGATFCMTR